MVEPIRATEVGAEWERGDGDGGSSREQVPREKKINRFVVQRMEGWADDGERRSDTDAYNTLTRSLESRVSTEKEIARKRMVYATSKRW